MSREKTIQVSISKECWIELGVIKLRKEKASIQEVIRELLESYTSKLINKQGNDNSKQ